MRNREQVICDFVQSSLARAERHLQAAQKPTKGSAAPQRSKRVLAPIEKNTAERNNNEVHNHNISG